MKKVFSFMAVAAVMLFAGKAYAQMTVHLGYAPVTYTTTYNNNDSKMEMNGFYVGANYNVNLTGDLNVGIGADFRFNTKTNEAGANVFGIVATSKTTSTQMLIDIPVLFNYGLSLNSDFRISAFAGPTFSLALSGKTTSDAAIAGWGGTTGMATTPTGRNSTSVSPSASTSAIVSTASSVATTWVSSTLLTPTTSP